MLDLTVVDDSPLAIPADLIEVAQQAIETCEEGVERIHTRSNTSFQITQFVLNHDSPTRNLRQVSAQLQRRIDALHEARDNLARKQATIRLKRGQAAQCKKSDPAKSAYLKEVARIDEGGIPRCRRAIEGALREVSNLACIYKQLYEQVAKKHNGKVDEVALEAEEAEYWVARLIRQALRDIRHQGTIGTGNQEALEGIGLDPLSVERMCCEWLQSRNDMIIDSSLLDAFVQSCASTYKDASAKLNERRQITIPTAHAYKQIVEDSE